MTALFSPTELERLSKASALLLQAEDRLPVLSTIAWDKSVAADFFANGEKELPRPQYTPIDPEPSQALVLAARQLIDGDSPVHDWLKRFCDMTEATALMLEAVGTKPFGDYSQTLYGGPTTPVGDHNHTCLDLAKKLDSLLTEFDTASIQLEPPEILTAEELKAAMQVQLEEHFGAPTPEIIITDTLSAKATAGRDYIKLRKDAHFSDLDVIQLVQHEALVHISTAQNGARQHLFPILAESHPANARTQEGLAVFAEYISGALDPRRFRRLANRTIAIDMAQNGADFLDVYRFFRENGVSDVPFEAFESTRRIFRGAVVEGGAPFTKDSVYLGGLIEVHSYLRASVVHSDPKFIRLLFVGKMDLCDMDAIVLLHSHGLISDPQILPPWAKDLRFLLSYLSYSTFFGNIDLSEVSKRYEPLFALSDS